jgi:DNA-binding winged helix-turn-helix (wHTH) protein/Tfp pilus assembly protein PilF
MPPNHVDVIVRFGRFTVDVRTRELWDGERRLEIQGKPFELLLTLLEDPGQLVTRETLYGRLWPGLSGDYQLGLDTAVRKLRTVLGDPAHRPAYIETLPRRGYRLLAAVSFTPRPKPADQGAGKDRLSAATVPRQADSEAENLYLEGYHCWNKRTPASQNQALAYFQRARELDPTNSAYHAAIAQTHLMRAWHGVERPVDAIAEAKSAAVVALLHNRTEMVAHVVLAWARGGFDYDLKGALEDLHAAIELAPHHPWGYIPFSAFSAAVGANEQADAAIRTAHGIDPVSQTIYAVEGYILYLGGRFQEAEEMGRKAVDRDPEFGLARFYYGQELLAVRRPDEAIRHLAMAESLMPPAPEVRATIGLAMALGGDDAGAAQIDQQLEEAARSRYVDAYYRALLKDELGLRDAAVSLLEEACEAHSHWFAFAAVDIKLGALRSDRRVQNLMRRLRR